MRQFETTQLTVHGLAMLRELPLGRRLKITSARTGAGTGEALKEQTAPIDPKRPARLVQIMEREEARVIRVQIGNDGEAEGFRLHQLMIYAALDDGGDGWEAEQDFIIMQDTKGFDVPTEANAPAWDFEVYCVLEISDEMDITLDVDPAGIAKLKDLERAIREHDEDLTAHPYLAALANSAAAAIKAVVTIQPAAWSDKPPVNCSN